MSANVSDHLRSILKLRLLGFYQGANTAAAFGLQFDFIIRCVSDVTVASDSWSWFMLISYTDLYYSCLCHSETYVHVCLSDCCLRCLCLGYIYPVSLLLLSLLYERL